MLSVCENVINFSVCILFCKLTELTVISIIYFIDSLGIPIYIIMPTTNREFHFFISSSYLIFLPVTNIQCLEPTLLCLICKVVKTVSLPFKHRENLPTKYDKSCKIFVDFFMQLRKFSSIHSILRVFMLNFAS